MEKVSAEQDFQEWLDHKVTKELHRALEEALENIPGRAWRDGPEEHSYWKHREEFILDLLAWKPDDVIKAEIARTEQPQEEEGTDEH